MASSEEANFEKTDNALRNVSKERKSVSKKAIYYYKAISIIKSRIF